MSEDALGALDERTIALERRLAAGLTDAERAGVKAEITAIWREVDDPASGRSPLNSEVARRETLKERLRALVAQWKAHGVPVVRADHIGASTFIEKGWSRLALGDHDGAESDFARALALSPGDSEALVLLGWAQMLSARYDDAMGNFQRVLARDPQHALARINVGYVCLKKGIFGEAIEHISKVMRVGADKRAMLYAHFYMGLVYFEREMYDDAEGFFLETLELGPNLVEAYFELGRSYWFGGRRDQARKTWQKGVAANSFSPWGKRCAELLATVDAGGAPAQH